MGANARGAWLATRSVLPHLRANGGGSVVLTASVLAFASNVESSLSSGTKSAVAAMTRSFAIELANERIRVNSVALGLVPTGMARHGIDRELPQTAQDELLESYSTLHPMNRLIEPEEVANVFALLLSDEASAVNGACYAVDAGVLAHLG